jgi:hypothetical protein
MTMKEQIRSLAFDYSRKQREQIEAMTTTEKYRLLLSCGWNQMSETDFGLFWEHPTKCSGGIQTNMACECELRDSEKKKREADFKDGTAVCHCNKCGADMQKWATNVDKEKFSVGYYGLVNAECAGGYESTALSDCVLYNFSLCEECLADLFEQFKTPPEIKTYL